MIKKLSPILMLCSFTMLCLLSLSAVFYNERMVFIDSSFYVFEMCRTGNLFIGHSRFGGAIIQFLPYLAMKMHMSLAIISFLYSISYVIYSTALAAILWFVIQDKKGALAIVLSQCLLVTFTFFWPVSELSIALSSLIFFQAFLHSRINHQSLSISTIILLPLMVFTLVFFHPLVIIGMMFIYVFLMIAESNYRPHRMAALIMLILFYIIRTLFIKTPYDDNARSGLGNVMTHLPNYFNLTSTKNSIKYFIYDYYVASLSMIFTFIMLIYKRKAVLALFYALSIIGMWMLINLNYPDGGPQFYLENQYNIMAFMTVIAFSYVVIDFFQLKYQTIIIGLIMFLGLIRIITTSSIFADRLDYYRKLIADTSQLSNKKLIIDSKQVAQDTLMMSWCASYEIWHLSTMEQGQSRSILIEESDKEFDWVLGKKNEFHQKFGNQNYKDLNPIYFILKDTSGYVRK